MIEFFYCFIYVSGLFISIYPYLDTKRDIKYNLLFLLIYAFIDFMITGDYVLHFHDFIIINCLVAISDFLFICYYNRKYTLTLLFYTITYFSVYMALINLVTYLLYYFQIPIEFVYTKPLLRFIFVFVYNIGSVFVFYGLKKIKIISQRWIVEDYKALFNLVSLLIYFVFLIIFGLNLINLENYFMLPILVIFIVFWLGFLYLLNNSILLNYHNKNLLMLNHSYKNLEYVIHQFEEENQEIQKIRHDMKNHLRILRQEDDLNKMKAYIDSIYSDLNDIKVIQSITGIQTLDILFAIKEHQYSDIYFSYHVDINAITIDLRDLCSLLFNLIDNACENISQHNRNVHIEIVHQFQDYVITVSNNVDNDIQWVSSKGKGRGYGLQIIHMIVDKYKGSMNMENIEDIVIVQITLES